MIKASRPVGVLAVGDSRMEWMLRLVGTGIDGQSRGVDVMAISRPDGLGDLANLAPVPLHWFCAQPPSNRAHVPEGHTDRR
jgi:hypothetical protein